MRSPALLTLLAWLAAGPAPAGPLDAAIQRRLDAEGPWLTPAEQRFVTARCGKRPGRSGGGNLRIEGDALHCGNGRVVRGPEVRAMARAIEGRAHDRVRAAMRSPEVRQAAQAEADAAIRRGRAAAEAGDPGR